MGPRRHSPFDPWIGQDHHRYDHRGMVRPPQVWPAYAIQPPLCGRPMPISLSNMDIVGSVVTWFCIPSCGSHGRVTYKSENVHLVWPPRREVDTCQCKSWIFPTIQCQPFTGGIFTIFPTIQEIFYFTNIPAIYSTPIRFMWFKDAVIGWGKNRWYFQLDSLKSIKKIPQIAQCLFWVAFPAHFFGVGFFKLGFTTELGCQCAAWHAEHEPTWCIGNLCPGDCMSPGAVTVGTGCTSPMIVCHQMHPFSSPSS